MRVLLEKYNYTKIVISTFFIMKAVLFCVNGEIFGAEGEIFYCALNKLHRNSYNYVWTSIWLTVEVMIREMKMDVSYNKLWKLMIDRNLNKSELRKLTGIGTNTRTTAVFFIKYLRTWGFDATNDIFAENAWYFRNALVRANYNDLKNGVHETTEYLELFLRNLVLNEKNELHNRAMHISGMFTNVQEANIESAKANIQTIKANIQSRLADIDGAVMDKTISHVLALYDECGVDDIFGRSIVEKITGLKATRASELIRKMNDAGLIVPVQGYGKGKYKFQL